MSADPEVRLTFGSVASIEAVAENVGQALDVTFELRNSMYLGGEYYRSQSDWGGVIVQRNNDRGEPPTFIVGTTGGAHGAHNADQRARAATSRGRRHRP